MSKFFINRPIFAWVLTIILCLVGVITIHQQSIEQYPNLAPTTIRISATYPGGAAETVENTVTQTIEQNMIGLDKLMYMTSQSSNSGSAKVTLYFEQGIDPNVAMQQVQNQLQPALRRLPSEVQQQGVRVSKSGDAMLMMMAFVSTDGSMTKADIADYIASHVQDPLSRLDGVGGVDIFGAPRAMRIWLDPSKLLKYNLTEKDVSSAIKSQNAQVSIGEIGAQPTIANQVINAKVTAQSQFQTAEQFKKILLKVTSDGAKITLADVAKVELGSDNYNFDSYYNGMPAAGVGITLASGANEISTQQEVLDKVNELSRYFPHGLQAKVAYDTTPFIKNSVKDVVITLIEAIILVFLIMYLFLQNLRATLIPTIAVPVVLLGTFSILYAFGFTINTLSMFAIVLAIGLLVDDAIVVVENVERIMTEEGLSPPLATKKAMGQIQSALVGIALVLSAVFIPMAFFGGTTGAIYRQFSVTIVSAMFLSVIVAMILTPALCATLLKPKQHKPPMFFFKFFNRQLEKTTTSYGFYVHKILSQKGRYFVIYVIIIVALGATFAQLSQSFLPNEDRGIFMTMVQLPVGSTTQQTVAVVRRVENYYLKTEKDNVSSVMATVGSGAGGNGQNVARLFIRLRDWSERKGDANSSFAIVSRATKYFKTMSDAKVMVINPPVISGLGDSGGISFMLEDQGGLGHKALLAARDKLIQLANQRPELTRVRNNEMEDTPQLHLNIDQHKAQSLGVKLDDINSTLKAAFGSNYVNDFVDQGRVKKVYVQALAQYRMQPSDLSQWYVKNQNGQMVSLSTFVTSSWTVSPASLTRFNGVSSLQMVGEPASGYSTGQAMKVMNELVSELPGRFGIEWTGISMQEQQSSQQAPYLYVISILFVFLCLAALYESWSIPFAVILVAPLGVIGAALATWMRGLDNDIYFQIGLLTVVGLSAKNAILIVEFANTLYQSGEDLVSATLKAVRIRLRPILMTSLAFIFGVLPMALSQGAGSGSQHAVGTGVIGGMITATLLTILFVPLFFVAIKHFFPSRGREKV